MTDSAVRTTPKVPPYSTMANEVPLQQARPQALDWAGHAIHDVDLAKNLRVNSWYIVLYMVLNAACSLLSISTDFLILGRIS